MKRKQAGYLLEVPIIVVVVGLGLALLLPHLPPLGQKIAVIVAALILIACAYYMIVIPGWQPGASRLRAPWSIVAFVMVTVVLVLGAGAFAMH